MNGFVGYLLGIITCLVLCGTLVGVFVWGLIREYL